MRFNATLFHTVWADLQAAGVVVDPITKVQIPTLVTTNVGEAEAEGDSKQEAETAAAAALLEKFQ